MKMMGLMLLIIIVLCSSTVFSEFIRFSGTNQNTYINSHEIIPYNIPQFGANITIRANVTDDNNSISWVNFTLISPDNASVINKENGTQFGEYWNSSLYTINTTGTWTYNVNSSDDDTSNTTSDTRTASFTITDNFYHTPNEITEVIPLHYNLSHDINLWTDSRVYLNFTLNHTMDNNFTINLSQDYIKVNSTQYSTFQINISSTASSSAGQHNGTLTIQRHAPLDRNFIINISISISESYGDVEFVSPEDYSFVSCGGTITHSQQVKNNGNYEMTDCRAYLYDIEGAEMAVGTTFTLGAGSNASAQLSYSYTPSSTIESFFAVECTANPNGSTDRTSDYPKITFIPGVNCGESSGGGGGGGAVTYVLPSEEELEPVIKEVLVGCGNGICEEDENPLSCPQDCVPEIFNLEDIFCIPIFKCGNWERAWFLNFTVVLLLGGFIVFSIRGPGINGKRRLS